MRPHLRATLLLLACTCGLALVVPSARGEGAADAGDAGLPLDLDAGGSPPEPRAQVSPLPVALDAGPTVRPPEPPTQDLGLEQLLNTPVVTSSGGKAEERTLAAATVTSLTREDIAHHGWRSLAEILEQVPGLYVVNAGAIPSVGVRGVTGGLRAGTRIVRVMINGTPVNFRPDLTAFIGPEFIPIEAIERVEVVKGPLSALYGANAFLATVNVITRTPDRDGHADVGARLHEPWNPAGAGGSALAAFGGDSASLLAAASMEQVDRSGLQLQHTFAGQQLLSSVLLPLFDDQSRNDVTQRLSVFAQLALRSELLGNLSLEGGLQRLDTHQEFELASVLTHQSRLVLTNAWSAAHYRRPLGEQFSLGLDLSYTDGRRGADTQLQLTANHDSAYRPNFGSRALSGKAELGFIPIAALELRAGLEYELDFEDVLYYTQTFFVAQGSRQRGSSVDLIGDQDPRSQTLRDLGGYLHASAVPLARLPDLHLTGDLRLDDIQYGNFGFPRQLSYRAAAVYRFSNEASAKLVGGRAFQTPSAVLAFAHPGFGNAYNVVGTLETGEGKSLRPQTVDSIEAGGSLRLLGRALLELSAFYQVINDRIEFVQLGSDFAATNQGSTRSVGAEVAFHLAYGRLAPYVLAAGQAQVVDGALTFDPPPSFPTAQAALGTDLDLSDLYLHVNAQARVVSARGATQSNVLLNDGQPYTLPGYVAVDATLSSVNLHPLGGSSGETRVLLTVRNLLDEHHSEPGFGGFDVPALGRTGFLELRQSF